MTVEVYVDAENLFGGLGRGFSPVDIGACVVESLERHEIDRRDVAVAKVFGPWGHAAREPGLGDVMRSIPRWMKRVSTGMAGSKSFADTYVVIDVLERHLTRSPQPNAYVLVGGDSDMIPFVRRLRRDTQVLGASLGRGVKIQTVDAYDRFVFLNPGGPFRRLYDEVPKGDVSLELRGHVDEILGEFAMLPVAYVRSQLEALAARGAMSAEANRRCARVTRVASFIQELFESGEIWANVEAGTIERGELVPVLEGPSFRGGGASWPTVVDDGEFDDDHLFDWDPARMLVAGLPLLAG